MYGLPNDFNADFFCGCSLEQICFTQNQLTFHFDRGVTVVVESAIVYGDQARGVPETVHRIPLQNSSIMHLLGGRVLNAFADAGDLNLVFENGAKLKCLDDTPQYEAYQIINNGNVIIV
jgi:Family of unknown function (DUF6188)